MLRTAGRVITRTVDLGDSPDKRIEVWRDALELPDASEIFSAYYAGPISAFHWLSYLYDNYGFSEKPLETEPERKLNSAELRALRNILGRTYERVIVRSAIADPGDHDLEELRLPYVSAWSGHRRVDSRSMSQGELWVHYILNWFLTMKYLRGT